MTENELFVIVPYRNDERHLLDTLFALAEQTDRHFTLVLVDYGSTDESASIASRFTRGMRWPRVERIHAEAGDPAGAVGTGFGHALARGARWLARIDPDCMPDPCWVEDVKHALGEGTELVIGTVERRPPASLGAFGRALAWLARMGSGKRTSSNLAVTADLYQRAAGDREGAASERVLRALIEADRARRVARQDVVVHRAAMRAGQTASRIEPCTRPG